MGDDPWQYGMTPDNVHQLDMLATFAHEQGLTSRKLSLDELFLNVGQGHKRGHVFRI